MKNSITYILLLSTFFIIAQENGQGKSNGTLNEQFEYVMQKSNNFQEYKVVKKEDLLQLKKSSTDSVQKYQKDLKDLKIKTTNHQSILAQLNDSLKTTEANLKQLQLAQDNVDMFGITLKKTNYNYLMWGIVSALLLILLLIYFQFKSAKSSARESRDNLEKMESEYEEYKHKALEKEQKLGRQLQDEINKHKAGK